MKHLILHRLSLLADQALSSVASFILIIAIGRSYPSEVIASYGLASSLALQLTVFGKGVFGKRMTLAHDGKVARLVGGFIGAHFFSLALALAFLALLALAFSLGSSTPATLQVAGLTAVFSLLYFLQEFVRPLSLKIGLPHASLLFSAGLAVSSVAFFVFATAIGTDSVLLIAAAIFIPCALTYAFLARLVTASSLTLGVRMWSSYARRYLGWSTLGVLSYAGYNHGPLFVLAAVSPTIEVAAYAATRSLLQPAALVIKAFDLHDKSNYQADLARLRSPARLLVRTSLTYAAAASAIGVIACLGAKPIIDLVFAGKFSGFSHLLCLWALLFCIQSVMGPFESLFFSLNRIAQFETTQLFVGLVSLICSVPLCMAYGAAGAIAAGIIGWLLTIATCIWSLRDVLWGKSSVRPTAEGVRPDA